MISYEAVESGARVLIEDGKFGVPWDDASEDDRAEVMARVRAILETSAENIQAQAWGDAIQYAYEEGYFTRPQLEALQESNPHRTTK